MYIAESIKTLRKKNDWTQEEMAEAVGVSPQSVSKWERGETYPDITLLPSLANLFKVTVDELIGMEKLNDANAKASVFKAGHEQLRQGNYNLAAETFANALKSYPNDEGFMTELAMVLALHDDEAKLSQAISLSEKVISRSPREKVRHTIRAALSYMYLKAGERDKANWMAENLPHTRENRERVLKVFSENPDSNLINTSLRLLILGESDKQHDIVVDFHENIIPICTEHDLIGKIIELRRKLDQTESKTLPLVRVIDNIHLPPNHVRVRHYGDYLLDKPFTDMNVAIIEIIAALRKTAVN